MLVLEIGSGLKLNQCALDSAAFTNCSGSVTLTGLSATDHIFRVQAQDQAGNLAVVQHNWTVSAVTPPPEPPPQPPPTGDTGMVTLGAVVTEGGGKYSIPVTFKNAASVQLSASHVNFSVLGTAICDKAVEVSGLVSAKVILTNCRNSGTLRIRLDAGTATSSTGEVAAAVGPSADILINASIKNPYYTATAWKVWGLDASPVNLTSGTVSSLALGSRNVPDFTSWSNPSKIDDNYTLFKLGGTDAAGSWDDGYASLDALHSNLGSAGWSDDYNHQVNLGAQYITTKTITVAAADIPKVGINFTSMSYANQGHQRACGNLYYEQSQYFRNTIDAAPGYLSYRETSSDRAIDQYDGLFSHYFNSVGRSSSEIGAIGKMMATAAFIPQATKNLLKKNGAYASAISMLFRSTLPYIDSSGAEVEFENELLHRPAYYSNGAEFSLEFHKFNLYYHRYDESQHFYRMAKMARSMDVAPPISIVQILGLSVMDAAGTTLVSNSTNDVRIKSQLKTSVRIWAEQNETLDLRLDVGSSYDLQGLPLTYSVTAVYPEHSLVKITREGTSSVYRIQVKYDPKFPKGRIPVVITANNGKFKSNPAFVNFYFKEPGQTYCLSSYFNISPTLSVEEVNRNLRPALTTSLPKDELVIQPGQTATFDIYCNDPEGFPTRIYRWSGERGVIAGNKFTLATSATDGNAVFPQHLICSDGTGGYNSRLVHVIVKKETDIIPSGWIMGPIGSPQIPAFAQVAGDTFDITGGGVDFGYASHRGNLDSGNMLYTNVTGNVDFAAQVLDIRSPGQNANLNLKAGVMIRWNSMDNSSRIFSTIQGNMNSGSNLNYVAGSRRDEGSWEAQSNDGGFPPTTNFFVRVVRIDNEFAAFRSVDGIHWQTQISEPWGYGYAGARPESVQVGFAISAGDPKGLNDWVTQAKMKRLPAAAVSIPIIKLAASRKDWVTNPALYSAPATLTAIAPSGGAAVVRYTKDGSDPTAASEILTSPMSLSTGQYLNLKFRAFDGSQQSDVVIIEAFQVQ